LAAAFRERGDVLTSSLEQSSQLGDRLNMFLTNLASALDQLRAQEPASSRPPVLRRQLAEIGAIFELLRLREPTHGAMKAQAQEAIAKARPGQQAFVRVLLFLHILEPIMFLLIKKLKRFAVCIFM
jgi:hypothetical protein